MRSLIFYFISILVLVSSIDYYELLGISKDADNRDIRKAFKKLALKLHPDKNMGGEKSHEQFIAINKAYEVLKDVETRKKYDLYGEEGLQQDFGKTWKGNYHSWNYYYENFGIYDDDPEIITLNKNDFSRSLLESTDLWFINFYSPQCSHCHHLAPVWRKLARELEGVLRIGAVNCEEDWLLCRQQSIHSYPSLVIYETGEGTYKKDHYQGPRDLKDMVNYVLKRVPNNVIRLFSEYFSQTVALDESAPQPWLIFTCKDVDGCMDSTDITKLGVVLDKLVNVAVIEREKDKKICDIISCESPIIYYFNLNANLSEEWKNVHMEIIEASDLVKKVLEYVPEPKDFSEKAFKDMKHSLRSMMSSPKLLYFTKGKTEDSGSNIIMKRLRAFLPEVTLGHFDCQKYPSTCSELYLQKFPCFILFRPGGSYEFHYGRIAAYDVASFAREALLSEVYTLTPKDFPRVIRIGQPWFIDFFAPWCPPCMKFLPHWRKASHNFGRLVNFGTVDCSIHVDLCRRYNIESYPTALLYNQSRPYKFQTFLSQEQIKDFIEEILNPAVVSLNIATFESLVKYKSSNEVWVIEFFSPWCAPCQQIAPHWRKLGKLFNRTSSIHIGEVDCQAYYALCHAVGITSYPTIRLYPKGDKGLERYFTYSGWSRDTMSLHAWIFNFLPSKVKTLTPSTYNETLADSSPWLIDYYAPWCEHCQTFAPEFQRVAELVYDEVKAGQVNCEQFPTLCESASIHAYPTVMFYSGTKDHPQNPIGIEVQTLTYDGVKEFLEETLKIKFQDSDVRDEL